MLSSRSGVEIEVSPYIDFGFQNLPCSRNRVSYDNNVTNIVYFHGRDETDVNSHKFSFN